jgi:hypothetical protein
MESGDSFKVRLIPADRAAVDAAKSFLYVCSVTSLSVTRAFHVACVEDTEE